MRRKLIKLLSLPITAMVLVVTANQVPTRENQLLILGDSLSAAYGIAIDEGWANLLDQRLQETGKNWQVRNVSISGSTTDNGLVMLAKALEHSQPQIVLIELGANDGLRGYPLALTKRNLLKLIQTGKKAGAQVLLAPMELPPNYGSGYTQDFRQIYIELAEAEEVTLLPFMLSKIYGNPQLFQEDQLHPTAKAQPIILDDFWPVIENAIDSYNR